MTGVQNHAPRIFLSYSLRGSNPLLTKAITLCSAAIEARGWVAVDPMQKRDVQTIDAKVLQDLLSADALIAEATASVPNVMFEMGFARALDLPVLPLVNMGMHSSPDLKAYFGFLGNTAEDPLASDLGKLEYLAYDETLTGPAGMNAFTTQLSGLFEGLERTLLSGGACLLRRRHAMLMRSGATMGRTLQDDHPFLRFVVGWLEQVTGQLLRGETSFFEVEAEYYPYCLKAFQGWARGAVWAIADLTDSTERFWHGKPDPLAASVSERVFLLPWEKWLRSDELADLQDMLVAHRAKYTVYVGSLRAVPQATHPLGSNAIGQHLLLIEPDLIGGYVLRDDRKYLRVQRDANAYREALERYERIRNGCVRFDEFGSEVDLRQAWVRKEEVGRWQTNWNSARTAAYFRGYDANIRAWVPTYENLLSSCARSVQREVMRLFMSATGQLRLLELGFGTGGLTRVILKWIETINRPFRLEPRSKPVAQFWAVDSSEQMLRIAERNLDEPDGQRVFLEHGTAFRHLPTTVKNQAPFGVIFGSLVFHDLLAEGLENVLARAVDLLHERGRLVFADPFYEENRDEQWTFWKAQVKALGLSDTDVESFFAGNEDMVKAISQSELLDAGKAAGFAEVSFEPAKQHPLSPFRVAVLRRASEKT